MKKETIVAYSGSEKEKNKKEVGRKEINIPETLKEAVHCEGGDESKVLKFYVQALRTNTRNSLAKPVTVGSAANKRAYEVYVKLIGTGMATDKALGITGLTADQVKALSTPALK